MDIDETRRTFISPDGEDTYYIKPPNTEDIRGADWQYSKIYTKSLTEGITTSAEMNDILRRRGIIGPEYEQRSAELISNLNDAIGKLGNATDIDEKRELAIKVATCREEVLAWNQRLTGPMNHTCEFMADDARIEYLTSCMVVDKEGKRIWDNYDAYLNEKQQDLMLKARIEVMLYLQGIDSNFMENTPEAQAIREVESELAQQAEEMEKLDKALEKEAEEVAAVKSEKKESTKPKKKKPSKRKTTAKKDVAKKYKDDTK